MSRGVLDQPFFLLQTTESPEQDTMAKWEYYDFLLLIVLSVFVSAKNHVFAYYTGWVKKNANCLMSRDKITKASIFKILIVSNCQYPNLDFDM